MKTRLLLLCFLLTCMYPVFGHHGVASTGVGGLLGPGSPLETSSSQTLPKGSFLFYLKLDHADWKTFTPDRDDEKDSSTFVMAGLGYAPTPYLSFYCFAPFNAKTVEDNSYNTAGFADISIMGVLGFKYDGGFRLVPAKESLDDLADWHFTIYTGATLPTGNANTMDSQGNIDPGMALGFGKPSWSIGLTATKAFLNRFTYVLDTSYIGFTQNRYADTHTLRFGSEFRINSAFNYRLYTNENKKLRADLNLEGGYLGLGRDVENGAGLDATGGSIVYLLPGVRLYVKNISFAVGVKFPVYTALNESVAQQGAEGKERLRLIFSVSTLF
ncbi:MAG: transporter [Candidatus Omnitrophota bacterium]